MNSMHISQEGLNLIKEFEGCSLKAYKNQGEKYYTIGYGHYGSDVGANQEISQQQADDMLVNDINNEYAEYVNKLINEGYLGFTVNQNQFDALTSFVYNLGFRNLKLLCQEKRNAQQVADKMLEYTNSGSEIYRQGLLRRRQAERELFLSQDSSNPVQANNNGYSATVRDYQKQYNETYTDQLVVDGIWGTNTENSLHNVLLKEGSKNSLVSFVQCRVGADIDCKYGPQTKNKVYEYQKAHGLVADGIVGYNTMKCILNQYK